MPGFNKVILLGNLTRSPELRYTPKSIPVCSLSLAVSRKYRVDGEQKEETCFTDVTVWGSLAETCSDFLKKGSPVLIEGRLTFKTWETNGQKRSKLSVTAESVQFLPKRESREQSAPETKEEEIPF